jgi:two-component sensor histidine kinase
LLITTADANYERQSWSFEQGNVTVLQRPLRLSYLLSAVEAGLRARRRQYQVRDLLEQTERARIQAERQHAEIELLNERLRRSMRETHHRVKNNLQVIAAMIDMQLLEGKAQIPASELRRLGSHVRTLATVHDMLTHQARQDGEAHHVSSRAILTELVPLIQQSSGDREVRMRADDVKLSARQSASLAIIVNELVSNAVKHGRGAIEIDLRTEAGCLVLEVSDEGEGFPKGFNPVTAANTGLELIEHLAAWDLAGEVTYRNRPTGGGVVTIQIPFPFSRCETPPGPPS